MSTEASPKRPHPATRLLAWRPRLTKDLLRDQTSIRIVRYAVGVTLASAIAYGIKWPLAFLVPVLTAVFLGMPLPAPTLRQTLINMGYILAAFAIGVLFTLFLMPFPLVYLPLLGLALFHIYYFLNRGGAFMFALMSLLAILILPMLSHSHEGLATGFALGFVASGWITLFMITLAHWLVSDPAGGQPAASRPAFQPGYSQPAALTALKSTIVVLPMVALFIIFNLSGQLLIMVFTAIFTLSPDLTNGRMAGRNSLISTLLGGVTAWVFYWLIVAVPEYHFFVALIFFTALLFGANIFSSKPTAKYDSSAFVALLILVNGSLEAGADFTSNFIWRVIFITLATSYVVAALMVLESFWPEKNKTPN